MVEFFIAKRYMLERKRQSVISILGIMIGVIVLTVSIGISNGLDDNMIKSVLSITSHIKYAPDEKINNIWELKDEIEKYKEIKGVVPNIPTQGIFKFKRGENEYLAGIKIQGFHLESAKEAMNLDNKIIKGNIGQNNNSIIIGSELSYASGASINDIITLVTSEGKEVQFQVSGIFQTGYFDYDLNVVMINLLTAQYITHNNEKATEFEIILYNPHKAEEVSKKLMNEIGIYGRTWGSMNRNLLSALALEKTVMIIVFSLLVVIAGFVVWATLNMLVREKIKDIGILRAMGYSRINISKIFMLQGVILGIIGIVLGLIISWGVIGYIRSYSIPGIDSIYYIKNIPVIISRGEIIKIVSANMIVILLSSFFPAYRASKLETQEALKYE